LELGLLVGGGDAGIAEQMSQGLSRSAVELGRDGVQCGLIKLAQVGGPGQVLAEQAVGVLVGATLPGLRGSQKWTWTPGSIVNCRCSAISLP
jgi:hypothetical protein